MGQKASKSNICGACSSKNATIQFVCVDCKYKLCEQCKVKHNQTDAFKSHAVTPLLELAVMCRKHNGQPALEWCISCKIPVCSKCSAKFHPGHDKEKIEDALYETVSKLPKQEKKVSETGEKLSSNLIEITEKTEFTNAFISETKQEIETHFENILTSMTKRKEEMVSELQKVHATQKQKLQNDLDTDGKHIDSVDNTLALVVRESSFMEEVEPTVTQDLTFYEFDKDDSLDLGKLVKKTIFVGIRHVSKVKLTGEYAQQIKFISSDTLGVLRFQSLTYYTWNEAECQFLHKKETKFPEHSLVDFAVARGSGNLYMTCSSSSSGSGCGTVHQYDIAANTFVENKQQWPREKFKKPTGLAVNRAGHIVVSDFGESPKQIYILKPDGSIIHKIIGREGDGARIVAQVKVAQKIGINPATGKLVRVAQRELVIGVERHSDGEGGGEKKEPLLAAPFYITWDNENRIIVSDRGADCVYMFDKSGKLLFTLGTPGESGNTDKLLNNPEGVCTDDHDHIFIAINGNIYVIAHKNGRVKQQIISDIKGDVTQLDFINQRGRGLLAVRYKQDDTMFMQVFSTVNID